MSSRNDVVNLINSWVGKRESNGSFKEIIDIYNSHSQLPRGIKMSYSWAWCACTWSALAIKLGLTHIMPIEISCGYLIDEAKKMECWEERDDYIPSPGDACLYDWQDNGIGDNTGWPDHVGTVTYVNPSAGYFVVTEGNYSNSVKKRTVSINGTGIRGFIVPKYDPVHKEEVSSLLESGKTNYEVAHEVIAGIWGDGELRKSRLTAYGYNYDAIRDLVNSILNDTAVKPKDPVQDINQPCEKKVVASCYAKCYDSSTSGRYVTTDKLYLRNDAGTNKKALCVMPKGIEIICYGYYNSFGGTKWPFVQVAIDGVSYEGFCSIKYLKKI